MLSEHLDDIEKRLSMCARYQLDARCKMLNRMLGMIAQDLTKWCLSCTTDTHYARLVRAIMWLATVLLYGGDASALPAP